jgi:hypothetical protein
LGTRQGPGSVAGGRRGEDPSFPAAIDHLDPVGDAVGDEISPRGHPRRRGAPAGEQHVADRELDLLPPADRAEHAQLLAIGTPIGVLDVVQQRSSGSISSKKKKVSVAIPPRSDVTCCSFRSSSGSCGVMLRTAPVWTNMPSVGSSETNIGSEANRPSDLSSDAMRSAWRSNRRSVKRASRSRS